MPGRDYQVTFENVAVSAAQDLFELKGAAGKIILILAVSLGATDTTLVTAQSIRLRARFLPATVTDGSGGTTPTPQPMDPGDSAASFTALVNNTTQATTSGTAKVLKTHGVHIYAGWEHTFDSPPVVGPGEAFVFELLSTTVSGTVHMSGTARVREYGG